MTTGNEEWGEVEDSWQEFGVRACVSCTQEGL